MIEEVSMGLFQPCVDCIETKIYLCADGLFLTDICTAGFYRNSMFAGDSLQFSTLVWTIITAHSPMTFICTVTRSITLWKYIIFTQQSNKDVSFPNKFKKVVWWSKWFSLVLNIFDVHFDVFFLMVTGINGIIEAWSNKWKIIFDSSISHIYSTCIII